MTSARPGSSRRTPGHLTTPASEADAPQEIA